MTAVLSRCGRYRYRLERELDLLGGRGAVAFLLLNPSTADAAQDDPTIRRCRRFAADLGATRLLVGNLFAFRATNPAVLLTMSHSGEDVVGPDNDRHLAQIVGDASMVIAGWGAASKVHKLVRARVPAVRAIVEAAGKQLHVLRLTGGGAVIRPDVVALDLRFDAVTRAGAGPLHPDMNMAHLPVRRGLRVLGVTAPTTKTPTRWTQRVRRAA